MIDFVRDNLRKSEVVELLNLAHDIIRSSNETEYSNQLKKLHKFIPFDNIACGSGNIPRLLRNEESPRGILDINFPQEYVEVWSEERLFETDRVFLEFLKSGNVINWSESEKIVGSDYDAAKLASDFGMNDGWISGHIVPDTLDCFVIFIGKNSIGDCEVSKAVIEYLTPFYSHKYFSHNIERSVTNKLTNKEIEVLNWVKDGKSSWEISIILHCSKRVVDFHMTNIKNKLNATSRSQAVAIALRERLIDF